MPDAPFGRGAAQRHRRGGFDRANIRSRGDGLNSDPRLLTLGVEEEYQIIDASGQLRSQIETLLAAATPKLGDKVKREMMQSVVEVGTSICANVVEARAQLADMRATLASLLKSQGLRLACAGTHPFAEWQEQEI